MKIGNYEVLGELGRGGLGVVYKARAVDGREVAVKVVLKASREALARFEREQRLLDSFTEEEGFVPVLDSGTEKNAPYLVMPLIPGTLRQRLDRGPLSVEETRKIGRALATAIGLAHARGIVHRDLKPENVLLTAERPLISELGLGKHFDHFAPGASQSVSISASGEARGTAGYMSPEQMKDAKEAGPTADVWALGAILHECLTGRPVFAGGNLVEVMQRVTRDPIPPLPARVPRELAAAIMKALARDPAARFPDGAALARGLGGSNTGEARSRKGLVLAVAGGVGLTAMAGALVLFALRAKAPPPPVIAPPPVPPPTVHEPTPARPTEPAPPVEPVPVQPGKVELLVPPTQVPGPLLPEPAKAAPSTKSELLAALYGPDSTKGAAAILGIDPDTKEGHDLLLWVLEKGPWYFRAAAVDALAKTKDQALLDETRAHASENQEKNALVREGVLAALARSETAGWAADLRKALSDKDWCVRRMVAHELGKSTGKATVDALIARWQVETNPLVRSYIRGSLEEATRYYIGPDPRHWADWWLSARDTIDLAAPDEEKIRKAAAAAEDAGLKPKPPTGVVQDMGAGVPIFVLPELGYSKKMMIPSFLEIERLGAKLKFISWIPLTSFHGLGGAGGVPYFPVDKFAEAFDEDRRSELLHHNTRAQRVAFIACGQSCWLAMRYASQFPENVAALILVSPSSSTESAREAAGRIMEKGKAEKNTELFHFGLSLAFDTRARLSEHEKLHQEKGVTVGEAQSLDRMEFTTRFADQQDSHLEELYAIHGTGMGACLLPDRNVFTEEAVEIPVLVAQGNYSLRTSNADAQAVARHYKGELVTFENSADFPFIEEPEKFFKVVSGFLVANFGKRR